uniref:RING-type E3 ubiquitin transferase n=1 Tax=Kalanchoe fedtschenkoi TaxID=63787 RepID=A0A7N1A125_KALFE
MVPRDGEPQKTIVIAIHEGKNSQYAVKWALNHLTNHQHRCVFVHVTPPRTLNYEESGLKNTGRPPTEMEARQYFHPYHDLCSQKGIKPEEVILEGIPVSSVLLDYISSNAVSNIVVGASTRYAITRKFRNASVAKNLATKVPASCTVHIIAKGKVQSRQPAIQSTLPANPVTPLQHPQAPPNQDSLESSTVDNWSRASTVASIEHTGSEERLTDCKGDPSMDTIGSSYTPESQSSSTVSMPWDGFYNGMAPMSRTSMESVDLSIDNQSNLYHLESISCRSESSGKISYETANVSPLGSFYSIPRVSCTSSPSACSHDMETEMSNMKSSLKQTKDNRESACEAAAIVSQTATLNLCPNEKVEEPALAIKEHMEEKIAELAKLEVERQLREIADEKSRNALSVEQFEFTERTAKVKTICEGGQQKTMMDLKPENQAGYKRYSIDEIEDATDHFSEALRVGEGGYGPVFKGTLDEAAVAIKILRPDISQGPKQFQKEVDILSCMRHPHLVRLVGACPEYGCLIYEYMENGSLEDRLFRKDDTPPISWESRFRIASEISTALLSLHQAKPEPMVHRDLKPANILLDQNNVAKISDVGLARLLPAPVADGMSNYQMTNAAGTFCYIDPEYQQTGLLGVKSDVYSLGIILLQIITAKPPMGLTHLVQGAIESDSFSEILDPSISDWPVEGTMSFAKLALKCCELSKKDRPDLGSVVVPELNRIRGIGKNTGENLEDRSNLPSDSPCQFPPVKAARVQVGPASHLSNCICISFNSQTKASAS